MPGRRPKGRKSKKYAAEDRAAAVAAPPAVRVAEQLLIDAIGDLRGDRVQCTSLGRAQFAEAYAAAKPRATVTCHFLDVHLADRARAAVAGTPGVRVVCTADPPEEECDLVVLPFSKNGEAERTRESLQAAHERLVDGGRMAVAVDNPDDTWLHDEMRKLFGKVTRRPEKSGVLYQAAKRAPLKRVRPFDCEFAFRDGDRLVKAYTRPGVFSHRRLDLGARALLEAISVEEGDRVLDLGSGAGPIGIALALRAPNVDVLAIDSNPRALQCVERTAELNGLEGVTTLLVSDARVEEPHTFDLVVANPPYFSNFAIATIFLEGAERAVRPGGCVAVVTRQPDWFAEEMANRFDDVVIAEVRSYFVVAATGR